MRYLKLYFVVAALLLAACGSDATTEATTDAGDSTAAATPSDDAGSDDSGDGDGGAATSGVADDGDDSDGDTISVSALDDIPQVCRDLMSDFLKDIEPVVSPLDWDNATLADFETISAEFEARADQFDEDSDAAGECDDIDLEEDENFDLIIQFAQDEAPGTVGFLNFISDFVDAASTALGDPTAAAGFETCEDAIAFMDGLMENYDSMDEVPVSELTAMADIVSVIFTCTPEQMTYFDSPEVNAFFEEFFG
ncbi:MAG: hypothetical protein AAGA65_29160 [Actinomycetota bacterium]